MMIASTLPGRERGRREGGREGGRKRKHTDSLAEIRFGTWGMMTASTLPRREGADVRREEG